MKEKGTILKLIFGVSESFYTHFTTQYLHLRLRRPLQLIKRSRSVNIQFQNMLMRPMKRLTWFERYWLKTLGKDLLLMISWTVTLWSLEIKFTKNFLQSVQEDHPWKRISKIFLFGLTKKSWTWILQMLKRTIIPNKNSIWVKPHRPLSLLKFLRTLAMEITSTF